MSVSMLWLWHISMVLTVVGSGQTTPRVLTSVGEICGVQDEFVKFLGVPYAIVDEKDLFGPAIPSPHFEIPFDAIKDPVICPQIVKGTPQGNIQCLNLNIYKPIDDNQTRLLPVMVFIHGGGFVEGDGNFETYSPKFLVKHDVIVVTVNYRLGPYGFLCLEQDKYTNQGIRDQAMALKWIKDNIRHFGGDDDNILLFGHSAGSTCVDFHMSSKEDIVFNKVILQSAVMVSPLITNPPKTHTYLVEIATRLGLQANNSKTEDLVKELSIIDTNLLINATQGDIFRPCVKGSVIKDTRNLKDINIMIGDVDKEMILFYKGVKNFENKIRNEMKAHTKDLPDYYIDKVEDFYVKDNLKDGTIDFGTDFYFNYPIERSIRHFVKHNATVFRYVFTYDGGRNFIKCRDNITAKGAAHGDELGYLFDPDIVKNKLSIEDQLVIKSMTKYWTTFAKYGNPTYKSKVDLWPRTEDVEFYMEIGTLSVVRENYREEQIEFWDSIYQKMASKFNNYYYKGETDFCNGGSRLNSPCEYSVEKMHVRSTRNRWPCMKGLMTMDEGPEVCNYRSRWQAVVCANP